MWLEPLRFPWGGQAGRQALGLNSPTLTPFLLPEEEEWGFQGAGAELASRTRSQHAELSCQLQPEEAV